MPSKRMFTGFKPIFVYRRNYEPVIPKWTSFNHAPFLLAKLRGMSYEEETMFLHILLISDIEGRLMTNNALVMNQSTS